MKKTLCLFFLTITLQLSGQHTVSFDQLKSDFIAGYTSLDIPGLNLDYTLNLAAIGNKEEVEKQAAFFSKFKKSLQGVQRTRLNKQEQLEYDVLNYEVVLNLERIALEKKWNQGSRTIQKERLLTETLGKEWYQYYLKRWIDKDANPKNLYKFGVDEISSVKKKMKRIRKSYSLSEEAFQKYVTDNQFLIKDTAVLQERFQELKKKVNAKAANYFPYLKQVPPISIRRGRNKALAIAPAYYSNNIFYYNFFDQDYDAKKVGWIYIHEGSPGHHYQMNLRNITERSELLQLFSYYSFIEGWAAYVEQFGYELGAYENAIDEYGQLEWDLVRSVRVCMDVGLNYYGWSDEKAKAFWKQHIKNKDKMADREIKRIKKWPAQVITYKYGRKILDELKGELNSPEALKEFHRQVLKHGDIPFSILKKHSQKHK